MIRSATGVHTGPTASGPVARPGATAHRPMGTTVACEGSKSRGDRTAVIGIASRSGAGSQRFMQKREPVVKKVNMDDNIEDGDKFVLLFRLVGAQLAKEFGL